MSFIVEKLRRARGTQTSAEPLLKQEAARLGCEMAVLQAVLEVESKGAPFDDQGRLILLPEKHVFYRELPKSKRLKAVTLGLAAKRWKKKNYKGLGGSGSNRRWDRLRKMAKLDETAALKACSYGLAQIMGFNFSMCGFDSVQDFVLALAANGENQIKAFVSFLETSGLREELQAKDWRAIARIYNGKGQVDYYAALLAEAYARIAGTTYNFATGSSGASQASSSETILSLGSSGYRVKALQERLATIGFPLRPDGDFGPATRRAVVAFQVEHGLKPDGKVGGNTETALEQAVPLAQRHDEARADLTVSDLRAAGSQTVKKADDLTRVAKVLVGTSVGAGALGETSQGLLDQLGTGAEQLSQLRHQLAPLMELASDNKWLLIAGVGLGIWYLARNIKQRRLEDAQSWRHAG
ncbi:N-acetylmuramidase domain-containing protein [Pseudovibrio sp. Ad26]|uniref:N-acetylmuramidase domain-containing protein n=1 Tax=Pseudovibrio sp. Ad26 TaxID=989410 RepID=UPI0007AE638E|nr:N-acetylmuramidase domain-containing protein [Pseudovibrio sp. Ad26]KZL05536.1 putative peptidoglycan binding domain protein [Pseudovibrio sp. Ad26]